MCEHHRFVEEHPARSQPAVFLSNRTRSPLQRIHAKSSSLLRPKVGAIHSFEHAMQLTGRSHPASACLEEPHRPNPFARSHRRRIQCNHSTTIYPCKFPLRREVSIEYHKALDWCISSSVYFSCAFPLLSTEIHLCKISPVPMCKHP